jgi:hypothetical protein
MDFITTFHWSALNDILKENFKDFVRDVDGDNMMSTFPIFQLATDIMSSNSVLWSGSAAENTFMNPILREQGWEVDVMTTPRDFVISRDMQVNLFRNVPDEPGFVRLEAANIESESLDVREVYHLSGHSLFYIVPDYSLFPDDFHDLPKPGKNILIQSIYDTLQLDKLSMMVGQHGPAFAASLTGFIPPVELIKQPKKTLFKFLGHLGTRGLEHFGTSSDSEENKQDSSYNESEKVKENSCKMTDFIKAPRPVEVPSLGVMMDLCPAIKCEGWPDKALSFFHRKRIWPDDAILNKLRYHGFHLVYKPLDPLAQDSVEWRISFSKAEITLFHNMDGFKVYCYRIFKAIYYCELTLPKVLCSYHMKTIFLWACERIPSDLWVESNLAQIIMGLLDDLLHCLVTKCCPHYFIPENNLFAHVHQDFLDHLAKVVSKIRRHPER